MQRMDGGRMKFVNVDKLFFSSLVLLIMKTDFCRLLGSLFKNLVFFLLLIDNILKEKCFCLKGSIAIDIKPKEVQRVCIISISLSTPL